MIFPDSLNDKLVVVDTIQLSDSVKNDSVNKNSPIDSPVKYNARDSMDISVQDQKLYLYGAAKVNYQNIELTADYIEFDMANNVVMASRLSEEDTSSAGKPVFKQGSETFTSDTIRYNFKTKKGVIKHIVTEQGDGYLHADKTKRQANGHVHLKGGKYTTCDLEHPHFYIGLTKAISTEKKIISGPAYFVMEDIPLPLIIPFGFFPSSKNRTAGILMPTYGESSADGFYLRNGGLYIPINDYVDVAVQGDIYTRGTWGFSGKTNYYWKYHFRGGFSVNFVNRTRIDEFPLSKSRHYSIVWNHTQDPKANPSRTFSANVNITSPTYNKYYSNNYNDLVNSGGSQQSSISYTKQFGSLFRLSTAFNYNQNNRDSSVTLSLPEGSFSLIPTLYPFRSKNMSGKPKWFENITLGYSAQFRNYIATKSEMLFDSSTFKNMKNGFTHNVPISLKGFKLFNLINITPGLSYSGAFYSSRIEKRIPPGLLFGNNFSDSLAIDTIRGLHYAHSITPSLGFSLAPKFYGILQSTKPNSYIQAIRHVITPSASFSYSPNMRKLMDDYRRRVGYTRSITEQYKSEEYYIYENSFYPISVSQGGIPPISLSLDNNLEMKVLSKKDTTGKPVKVPILEKLSFSTSYDFKADSLNWDDISVQGNTGLFKNKINLNFSGVLSPYSRDRNDNLINKSLLKDKGKLVRIENFRFSIDMNFSSSSRSKETSQTEEDENIVDYDEEIGFLSDYADFDIPWSFSISYGWNYLKLYNTLEDHRITQTLSLSGNISITKKWKIGGNTGWDFKLKELVSSNIRISRDLHCWEMSFNAIPFGQYRSYFFSIQAKGSFLRDLKWDKRKQWQDYFY